MKVWPIAGSSPAIEDPERYVALSNTTVDEWGRKGGSKD
jgi:hypothetical protein